MRLREQRLYSRTVSLKLRDEDFFTITRAATLDHATQLDREIASAVTALFRQAWDGKKPIRLLGVHAGSLQAVEGQMNLLEEAGTARLRDAFRSVDHIRNKFRDFARENAESRYPRTGARKSCEAEKRALACQRKTAEALENAICRGASPPREEPRQKAMLSCWQVSA